jgi:hypothetical protein
MLTAPVPNERLKIGDVETVVHVYADGRSFEIEFMTLDDQTAAAATVEASSVRPITSRTLATAEGFVIPIRELAADDRNDCTLRRRR